MVQSTKQSNLADNDQRFVRIGVDVGGTNTDAVVMCDNTVLAWHKTQTTEDISTGVVDAIRHVLINSDISTQAIQAVMVGSTHFINAILQRRELQKVAAIRLCLPAASLLPPFVDWPSDLVEALGGTYYLAKGGYEIDGSEISALDESEIVDIARDIRRKGIQAIALTGVFSFSNCEMEKRAADILHRELPGVAICLSHEIACLGLLERENATILNAALLKLATKVNDSLQQALQDLMISAPLFLCENDGTLMSRDYASRYPVMTFSSGASNSMRGAAFLAGKKNAVVIDVGGTTSDIGMLVDGFPREVCTTSYVCGVRTNFKMPDTLSLAMGGGSLIHDKRAMRIGPDSLGDQLTTQALLFGGDKLCLSDVMARIKKLDMGTLAYVEALGADVVEPVEQEFHERLDAGIEQMKLNANLLPLVLVGGGAGLVSKALSSVSEVIVPQHASVANAVGAAVAQVSGLCEVIIDFDKVDRGVALQRLEQSTIKKAIDAGACKDDVSIKDVREVPLTYLPGDVVRITMKAVGALNL